MKTLIIDSRMRNFEKERFRSLGYSLIELEKSKDVYDEISAHPDIFCTFFYYGEKTLIVEPSRYDEIHEKIPDDISIIKGEQRVGYSYPEDIKYNVCLVGKYAIHNFKYTDPKVLDMITKHGLHKIQVGQGYTNCSIAVIDEHSIITEDEGIYKKLKNYELDVLLVEKEDIKLLNGKSNNGNGYNESDDDYLNYSEKKGFIGGTISRIDDFVFITGDIMRFKSYDKIKKFIETRNLTIIDFPGMELIDYGGIVGGFGDGAFGTCEK